MLGEQKVGELDDTRYSIVLQWVFVIFGLQTQDFLQQSNHSAFLSDHIQWVSIFQRFLIHYALLLLSTTSFIGIPGSLLK